MGDRDDSWPLHPTQKTFADSGSLSQQFHRNKYAVRRHHCYKVTGDVVNVAARIEQLNKKFNSQLLVSEEVLNKLGDHPHTVSLGPIAVKGRERPVEVFELIG
ncbi:MAG: adenylate/guanylate cyclase domain-containing protein [Ignavibacteriae bacterium]|nr:adenylate/guanylate cyclase domain-containing protein [Ignavibacteriota bacterium]